MTKTSEAYKRLCTEFYELDKPIAPEDALKYYLSKAFEANGKILEPMCGSGRFLIPLLQKGYDVTGFDTSSHMLEACKEKCSFGNLEAHLLESSFESFKSLDPFQLIFIPSGSFCLLTGSQAELALKVLFDSLAEGGKFIVEIETIHAAQVYQGVWRSRWIDKPDGSLLVGNFASRFNDQSRIETSLCRYELWQNNTIVQTEVEVLQLQLYETDEIENLLRQAGFEVEQKCISYSGQKPEMNAPAVLYECIKPLASL